MKITVYSTKSYDKRFLEAANRDKQHELHFIEARLTSATAPTVEGTAACVFVNDELNARVLSSLSGAVVDTTALIKGLKSGVIGSLGLDVYEEEADLFFENLSDHVLQDDVFARLLTFPNVVITAHQAFFTHEALSTIAATTLANVAAFEETGRPLHEVSVEHLARA